MLKTRKKALKTLKSQKVFRFIKTTRLPSRSPNHSHSGGHDRTAGVALVLRQPFNNALVTWQPISSCLLCARLIHRYGHLSMVVAYANDADKDAFYNNLPSVTESISAHDNLLLLGNFNTMTGPRLAGYEDTVGPFGAGTPNNNTSRPLSFCCSHGLVVPGSWFRHLVVHRWTSASNDGRTKKEMTILSQRTFGASSHTVYFAAQKLQPTPTTCDSTTVQVWPESYLLV